MFGVALIVMAGWFLRPVHPALAGFTLDPAWGLWAGIGLVAVGVALGAIHLSFKGERALAIRKGLGVSLATVGALIAVNNVLYVPPMEWDEVSTMDELTASIEAAEAEGKPVLIDFAAEWCLPCKEMELKTFHHESVEPTLAKEFHLIKIDATDPTDEQEAMKSAFASATLPSVLIYGTNNKLSAAFDSLRAGQPMPAADAHFTTFVEAEAFLEGIANVQ